MERISQCLIIILMQVAASRSKPFSLIQWGWKWDDTRHSATRNAPIIRRNDSNNFKIASAWPIWALMVYSFVTILIFILRGAPEQSGIAAHWGIMICVLYTIAALWPTLTAAFWVREAHKHSWQRRDIQTVFLSAKKNGTFSFNFSFLTCQIEKAEWRHRLQLF